MAQLHILIVDDDHEFLESMSEMIESKGHRTTLAHNGLKAMQIFKEEDIDLLLVDLKMPGVNGIYTYKELLNITTNKLKKSLQNQNGRKTTNALLKQANNKAPIIIITGNADVYKEELEELKSAHTLDIIQKPFKPEVLLKKIEEFSALL